MNEAKPDNDAAQAAGGTALRVGVFGGSFNPPHVGHVLAATLVLSTGPIDRLLVVPTFRHPFGKPLASFDDRVAMCQAAMGLIPRIEVSRVEAELGGESRTLWTLEHLKRVHPNWQLRLVVGGDIVNESHKWFGYDAICELAPPLVLGRAGVDARQPLRTLLPEVSSTDVRAMIERGEWDALAEIVPRDVLAYVRARGLYGGEAEGGRPAPGRSER